MACLFHAPLLLLTTLMVAVNLSAVLGHTLLGVIQKYGMQEKGAPEALDYAFRKYNKNNNELHLSWVVEIQNVQEQVCDP